VNDDFILIKPSDEYIDEIRSFRQEFIDRNEALHGDTGLGNCENPQEWIEKCHHMEHKDALPHPEWAESTQYMLVIKGERKIYGVIDLRHYLTDYLKKKLRAYRILYPSNRTTQRLRKKDAITLP